MEKIESKISDLRSDILSDFRKWIKILKYVVIGLSILIVSLIITICALSSSKNKKKESNEICLNNNTNLINVTNVTNYIYIKNETNIINNIANITINNITYINFNNNYTHLYYYNLYYQCIIEFIKNFS